MLEERDVTIQKLQGQLQKVSKLYQDLQAKYTQAITENTRLSDTCNKLQRQNYTLLERWTRTSSKSRAHIRSPNTFENTLQPLSTQSPNISRNTKDVFKNLQFCSSQNNIKQQNNFLESLTAKLSIQHYISIPGIVQEYILASSKDDSIDTLKSAISLIIDYIVDLTKKHQGIKKAVQIYESTLKNQGCRYEVLLDKYQKECSSRANSAKHTTLPHSFSTLNSRTNFKEKDNYQLKKLGGVHHTTLDLSTDSLSRSLFK